MKNDEVFVGKYANLLMDRWFKRSFGTDKWKRLTELLIQELIPERKIQSLSFAPQEHVNPFDDDKDIRVDVECTDVDGSRFVVELQLAPQKGFYERALLNASFAVQEQIGRGERGYLYPPVYFIGIMDFSYHEGSDRVLYRYNLVERESGEMMTDRLQFLFLELPNCLKALTPESSTLDDFCYYLRNMKDMASAPEGNMSELNSLLFKSGEISNFTPGERVKYINDMTTKRDIENQIEYAMEKGMQKGLEKGMEQGMQKNKLELAKNFKNLDVPIEIICQGTGLTKEQVEAL